MEEVLRLIVPTIEYADEYVSYRQEFLDSGDSMDGTGPMRRFESAADWLCETEAYTRSETVPEGLVQATQFICVNAHGRILGMIQVRHYFNEIIQEFSRLFRRRDELYTLFSS